MKLSKTSWLLLVIGIFIIALTGLGVVRYQQIQEANQLRKELALTGAELNRVQLEPLSSQREELETQLSQVIAQFEAAMATFSQSAGSISTIDILFDIAETHGVEIVELGSSGPVKGDLEGVPCSVLSLEVMAEGVVADLVGFITELNSAFATGVVQSVEIGIPGAIGEVASSATIQLVIYTYQGD